MKNKYFYFIPYFLLANILFIASNIPLLLRVIKTPPAYIQFYDHMSIMSSDIFDYNQYLSAITQGKNGYFLYEDAFTSEKTKPGLFFTFYILLGQISRPFNLWPPIIYNLARILAVELFFIAVFILTASAVGMKHAFWASSVSIFATIAPYSYFSGIGSHSPYFLWYEFLVPTGRIDSPPHHILGQTLLLFSIYFIFLFIRGGRKKYMFCRLLYALFYPVLFSHPVPSC
ncbi:hypothetical protein HY029_06290 [Candidatus Gottesmanbacteria bacterium]|nr:hypothetical protein [Candidatus Gottesmanbacteria bacterium]